MKLSIKQSEFLDAVLKGHNVFLTGKAGTGKTFVVKESIKKLVSSGKKVIAIAPTGVAANNVGGQTIHSMFSITPHGVSDYSSCNNLKGDKKKLLQKVDTILIDEVSMIRADLLDAINWTLLKNGCPSLADKQIIFVGDMKQLPPPIDDNTRSVLFQRYEGFEFYFAKIYPKLNVTNIELDQVLRQSNPEFIEALNTIRDGLKCDYFKKFIGTEPKGVILAPHNETVDKYNRLGINAVSGEEYVFHATITGDAKTVDFNLDPVIRVKNGCRIMYLANSKEHNELVNGTIGTFVARNGNFFIKVKTIEYALNKLQFTKKKYVLSDDQDKLELKDVGSIEQYPIKLAYALSIHKSQGLTFDEVTVDLSLPCFSPGQFYVAVSRVTGPEGLRIIIK